MSRKSQFQKIRELRVNKDSSHTEQSAYWDGVMARGQRGESREHPQANPDILAETEIAKPSTPQMLMGEAIAHLQGRQKEVYFLTMREDKSLAEAAKILEITKGSVQQYRDRAIKFISQYCAAAITKGRV